MCGGNTPTKVEGLSLVTLTQRGRRITWCGGARRAMCQHLRRHRIGRANCDFLFMPELLQTINCAFPGEFAVIVVPRVQSTLRYMLQKLETQYKALRYDVLGEPHWASWTDAWLRPDWGGDLHRPKDAGGRGSRGAPGEGGAGGGGAGGGGVEGRGAEGGGAEEGGADNDNDDDDDGRHHADNNNNNNNNNNSGDNDEPAPMDFQWTNPWEVLPRWEVLPPPDPPQPPQQQQQQQNIPCNDTRVRANLDLEVQLDGHQHRHVQHRRMHYQHPYPHTRQSQLPSVGRAENINSRQLYPHRPSSRPRAAPGRVPEGGLGGTTRKGAPAPSPPTGNFAAPQPSKGRLQLQTDDSFSTWFQAERMGCRDEGANNDGFLPDGPLVPQPHHAGPFPLPPVLQANRARSGGPAHGGATGPIINSGNGHIIINQHGQLLFKDKDRPVAGTGTGTGTGALAGALALAQTRPHQQQDVQQGQERQAPVMTPTKSDPGEQTGRIMCAAGPAASTATRAADARGLPAPETPEGPEESGTRAERIEKQAQAHPGPSSERVNPMLMTDTDSAPDLPPPPPPPPLPPRAPPPPPRRLVLRQLLTRHGALLDEAVATASQMRRGVVVPAVRARELAAEMVDLERQAVGVLSLAREDASALSGILIRAMLFGGVLG